MKRKGGFWSFTRDTAVLLGSVTLLLIVVFSIFKLSFSFATKPVNPTLIPSYPVVGGTDLAEPLVTKSTTSPGDSAYPPPAATNPVPSPVATGTATPMGLPVTITPIPITPFPTLTLVPGPSPTLIPIPGPAKDSSGMIIFVGKEDKDAKSAIYSLEVDATGKKTKEPSKMSDSEAQSDGFVFPSPNGDRLAITGPWGALNIFNAGKNIFEKMAITLGSDDVFFNWFPDNRQILWGGSTLVLSDPVSGAQTSLVVPGYGGISGAAASPDGQLVVYGYTSSTIYAPGLWVINANGQNPHLLAKGEPPSNIAWSPDGKKIAFFGAGWQIINADGSDPRDLAPGVILPQCYFLPPLWSPDSSKIALVTTDTGNAFCQGWTEDVFKGTNIILVNVDSGKSYPLLSDDSKGNIDPSWSPDGSQIAFVSNRRGTTEIWAVNVDGSNLHQLTANDNQTRFPTWSKPKQ
jgi:dipeptidyl aminopeptidase/acylaminoacyl peptidase